MPYTDKFNSILGKYKREYNDKAKAEFLAYKDAFQLQIPTFQKDKLKYKLNHTQTGGDMLKMKKMNQMNLMALFIPLLIAVIIGSLIFTQITSQTTIVNNPNSSTTFTNSSTACTRLTQDCLQSITSVMNQTNGVLLGSSNYTRCSISAGANKFDGISFASADTSIDLGMAGGSTVNVAYTSSSCGYMENAMQRTIVNYLPVLLAVVLLVAVAGYIILR